jgi:ElaB/YqjD/DUF883 family membrane-anchored ribosome-binding protein
MSDAEDTARIRSEIARTREDMSETIDAIQDKLSPRNLASQARQTMKEATVGRVKQAARSIGDSASGLAEQTRDVASDVAGTVRSNPWPALLIGAGAAWMIYDAARSSRRSDFDYDDEDSSGTDYRTGSTSSYYQAVRTRPAYEGSEQTGNYSSRGQLSQVSSQVSSLMQRNPLVVGAVAAAVGVAIGLAVPETERENELMGETRDNLLERAQGAAQSAVQKAKQVAGDAAAQVAGEAAKQVVSGEPAARR